jgi:glycosyltransferase involved in cell wall biosynthesis
VPIVSVVIPVWNRANVIVQAIASVVTQELPASDWSIEVIVVDDGSTDDLGSALHSFGAQIRTLRHEKNSGAAAARNSGIAMAKGDFLAFLDSDDTWLPGKLTAQIAFMREHGHAVSCTACELLRPGKSNIIWPRYKTGRLTQTDVVWGCILSPGTTMVCERRVFAEIGTFDASLQRHEDWDWLLRLTSHYDLAYLASPLAQREPSAFGGHQHTLAAIDKIGAKHRNVLPPRLRRAFEAALAFETAAARYRQRKAAAAVAALLRSVWLAPIGHAALNALIAGRFARA